MVPPVLKNIISVMKEDPLNLNMQLGECFSRRKQNVHDSRTFSQWALFQTTKSNVRQVEFGSRNGGTAIKMHF